MKIKNKKYLLLICILLVLFLASVVSVFAHPGRTDSNGGHWNRSTGTYHYHTGEYAGRNSSSSSTNSTQEPFEPPYEPPTNENQHEKEDSTEKNKVPVVSFIFSMIFLIIPLGATLISIISSIVMLIYEKFIETKLPQYKISKFNQAIDELYTYRKELEELKNFNFQIPTCYEIGADNLPKDKNSVLGWGKSFTLYKTYKGTKLHTKYNCCSLTEPLHIYNCRNYHNFHELLCKKCAYGYVIPDMTWYEDYSKYKQIASNQQDIEISCDKLQKEINVLHKKCNSTKTKIFIIFSKKNKRALQTANNKYKEMLIKKYIIKS